MVGSKDLSIQELRKIPDLASSRDAKSEKTISTQVQNALQESGYKRENLYNQIELETPRSVRRGVGYGTIKFEIIAAESPTSPPHLAVVIDPSWTLQSEGEVEGFLAQFLLACRVTARAKYSVLFTDSHVAILGQEYPPESFSLKEFSEEKKEKVLDLLNPPEEYPTGRSGKFPAGYHPNQTKLTRWLFSDSELTPEYQSEINTEYYSLDIDKYSEMLYEAYTASSTQKKGDTLEDVAELLFSQFPMLSVRDRNLRTKSGEIDLVLEYNGYEKHNLFEYVSRFIPVECKNISSSVSSKEVGYFLNKVKKSGNDVGILIAWNGISGSESGENARRIVEDSRNETYVIVLDSSDLYEILGGKSLYELVDEKLYELKFDL